MKIPKKINKYLLACVLIILLAAFLRFFRFSQRWVLYSDTARDALVAREALRHKRLPLTGSFSSAGPFVFGPLFYWFIMISYLPSSSLIILPWLMIALVSVIFVIVSIKIGQKLEGKSMGLILGLMAAVSPAQIARAPTLTQHSLVAISSILVLWTFVSYLKSEKKIYLFLMGLALGLGLSMHYQTLNLMLFGLAVFLAKKLNLKKLWQGILIFFMGILIPSLPLLIWDRTQNWANTKNVLDYLLIGQYRVWVSNRWLIYVFDFWPKFWSSVIGGQKILGFLLMGLVGLIFLKQLIKRKLPKTVFWLAVIFLIQIIALRYYRGEKFEGYLIYLHPLVLLFSAWAINQLFKTKKLLGTLFLILVIGVSLLTSFTQISQAKSHAPANKKVVFFLQKKYPEKKFLLYNHSNNDKGYLYALLLLLDGEKLIHENGIALGVQPKGYSPPERLLLPFNKLDQPYALIELKQEEIFEGDVWEKVTPASVYEEIIFWWQRENFQSPFSLTEFILGTLKIR